jgi:hypothetical protein
MVSPIEPDTQTEALDFISLNTSPAFCCSLVVMLHAGLRQPAASGLIPGVKITVVKLLGMLETALEHRYPDLFAQGVGPIEKNDKFVDALFVPGQPGIVIGMSAQAVTLLSGVMLFGLMSQKTVNGVNFKADCIADFLSCLEPIPNMQSDLTEARELLENCRRVAIEAVNKQAAASETKPANPETKPA